MQRHSADPHRGKAEREGNELLLHLETDIDDNEVKRLGNLTCKHRHFLTAQSISSQNIFCHRNFVFCALSCSTDFKTDKATGYALWIC